MLPHITIFVVNGNRKMKAFLQLTPHDIHHSGRLQIDLVLQGFLRVRRDITHEFLFPARHEDSQCSRELNLQPFTHQQDTLATEAPLPVQKHMPSKICARFHIHEPTDLCGHIVTYHCQSRSAQRRIVNALSTRN